MASGAPVTLPVSPADGVVIHTFDAGNGPQDPSGRPYLDVVTLVVQNNDPAAVATVLVVHGPTTLTFLVPAGESLRLYDETAFGGVLSGTGGQEITLELTAQSASTAATAWGWFVRAQG